MYLKHFPSVSVYYGNSILCKDKVFFCHLYLFNILIYNFGDLVRAEVPLAGS